MRAYYSGKMDLVQAEAVNDLINAQTEEAKKLHLYSLTGETSKLLTPIKNELADILSLIEVNIDYPEYEDIEQMTNEKIIASLGGICKQIDDFVNIGCIACHGITYSTQSLTLYRLEYREQRVLLL